jgi:hypothetical protein
MQLTHLSTALDSSEWSGGKEGSVTWLVRSSGACARDKEHLRLLGNYGKIDTWPGCTVMTTFPAVQ